MKGGQILTTPKTLYLLVHLLVHTKLMQIDFHKAV